ncbi:MAG TPA: adenylate/guanylate cyclase domain-containing protein [Xanthomonadales bacterium]|nr:adenylate/guanylate cyclase domain-containing protein [Xanthomonadales bacterium]
MAISQPTTILFADVSGSTKLFELKGDVAARTIISAVLAALGDIAARHGGRVIKTIGDEVMCTFPNALNGLLAAIDMQKRLSSDPGFTKDNLAIRIGLHHGDTLHEDNDVYGDAVNTAARMGSLAKREQIVTTATTAQSVTPGSVRTRSLGTARVSGKMLPIEIVDVIWQEDMSNVTTVQRAIRLDSMGNIAGLKLTLRHKGRVIELDPTSQPFTLGRDANSSLVIDAEWVSRNHAMIEYKRGYFMISDRSTNGTWVKLGEDDELRLHRDEIHLRKTGTISLGQAVAVNKEDTLYFSLSGG